MWHSSRPATRSASRHGRTQIIAAPLAYRVDLVDEHAPARWARRAEQVAQALGAEANEHLDEPRAGGLIDRQPGLAGQRARKKGLAGARTTVKDGPARQRGPHVLVLLRVGEEVEHLLELLDRLVAAGDVDETRTGDRRMCAAPCLSSGAPASAGPELVPPR